LSWFNRVFDQITIEYINFLKIVLRNRLKTLGVAVALFIGSLLLIPYLGSSFLPPADLGEINITAEFDAGLNLDAAGKITEELEGIIRSCPEVHKIYSTVRAGGASIYVKIPEKGQRQFAIEKTAGELRQRLNSVPGVKVVVNSRAEMIEGPTVQYLVLGEDLDELQKYAEKAQKIMESTPGAVDVGISYKPGKPEVRVEVKRNLAADLGISTAQVSQTLATLFNGTVVSQYEEEGNRYDVRVRLADTQRQELADLSNIFLPGMVPLSQVTETVFSSAPNEISRYDRTREITLSANLENTSLGEFEREFMKRVEQELEMPEGYRLYASGQSEFMGDTFNTMFIALFAGILFIFFILAAQFESYIDPFSIMLSIPLAVVGAILGLLVTGSDLSVMSMIGMIMLMGLVTKNAILLIDFTKKQRALGVERNEALQNAARIRLRPIVMTSLAMIFGMTPLALGLGSGAESRAPMAHAVIGGLITSTLLTLVVVPVVYSYLDDLKKKIAFLSGSR
jgi:multidrug efflux pump subunit AcrB